MDRNSQHFGKPDGQNHQRPVFDKDQPSEPAGGPNPGRYERERPPGLAHAERNRRPKGPLLQEGEPRDTPDVERPPGEDVTDAADDRPAPPFTGEDVEHPRKTPDSQRPKDRQVH